MHEANAVRSAINHAVAQRDAALAAARGGEDPEPPASDYRHLELDILDPTRATPEAVQLYAPVILDELGLRDVSFDVFVPGDPLRALCGQLTPRRACRSGVSPLWRTRVPHRRPSHRGPLDCGRARGRRDHARPRRRQLARRPPSDARRPGHPLMCLMAPARVLAIEPDFAIVEAEGRRRRASTLLVDGLHPGDWVVIAGGAVVRRVEADQAEMMARAFRIATGIDIDDDLDDERHHFPTEDPGTAPARHPHPSPRAIDHLGAVPMTSLRAAATAARIPLTASWGIRLAVITAIISGVSCGSTPSPSSRSPTQAVYTTLKNLVRRSLILIGGASLMGGVAEARTLTKRQWRTLLIVGIIGGSIPFLLFFTGLAQATAPGAAFIQKTLFIWVALLAVPFLGEKLGALQIGALGVLVVGQFLLVPPKLDGVGWGSGETMIAIATALWAVEVVVVKKLLTGVSPAVVGASRLGFGVVFLFGYLAVTGGLAGIATLSAEGWLWVAITGVLLAGYVGTWFSALRRAPASAVASVLVLGAVITAVLQAISNGAFPAPTAVVGSVVLVVAATLVAWGALRTPRVDLPTPVRA